MQRYEIRILQDLKLLVENKNGDVVLFEEMKEILLRILPELKCRAEDLKDNDIKSLIEEIEVICGS